MNTETAYSLPAQQKSLGLGVESTHNLPLAVQKLVIKEKFKKNHFFVPEPSYMKFSESRYDLPLEPHRNAVKKWLQNLPSSHPSRFSFAPNMSRTLSRGKRMTDTASSARRNRFSSLDPNILLGRLSSRPYFDFVKDLAIEKLECEVMRQLELIYQNFMCSSQLFTAENLPHRIFSWTKDDFVRRRKLTDFLWLELLAHQGAECLGKQKFQFDLQELSHFVKKLFNKSDEDIYEFMMDAYDFLNFHEVLEKELDKNKKKFREDLNMSLAANFTRRNELENTTKRRLAQELMDFDVISPIQMRYHLNYIETGEQQTKIKVELAAENLQKQLHDVRQEMRLGQKAFQDAISMYYTHAQDYKHQISEYSKKYDADSEIMDNKNNFLKNSIEKLSARRKLFEEQIVRFHDEIEKLHLKDLAAKEANEQRLLQEAQELELKKQKKKEQKAAKKAAKKAKAKWAPRK